ncbi:MAG: tyrosine-type recombinase/integrase [Ornithinibacter sp.]|jgi:hypothetical protein|nr:tyrosine-type recombinase/integrase [Ornithinibacter sp.]
MSPLTTLRPFQPASLSTARLAAVELYIRSPGERGLMDSSVVSMLCSVLGFFEFAHIDGLIPAEPCTPGYRRSSTTSPASRAWTGSN